MPVFCGCRISGRGLCDGSIPRPEEFYRLWCVIVRELETSMMRRPWPALGCCARAGMYICTYAYIYVYMSVCE